MEFIEAVKLNSLEISALLIILIFIIFVIYSVRKMNDYKRKLEGK